MKRMIGSTLAVLFVLGGMVCARAEISPVKLKVAKHQKSDRKETYRSSDGMYSSNDKTRTIYYTIDLTNVSSGAAKEFTIKWAVLVRSDRHVWINGSWKNGELKVIQGEKKCTLDFAKSASFETDTVELSGSEWVSEGSRQTQYEAKVLGYSVEVFCNDQRVAADIQPADTKAKIEQASGEGGQKRHQF